MNHPLCTFTQTCLLHSHPNHHTIRWIFASSLFSGGAHHRPWDKRIQHTDCTTTCVRSSNANGFFLTYSFPCHNEKLCPSIPRLRRRESMGCLPYQPLAENILPFYYFMTMREQVLIHIREWMPMNNTTNPLTTLSYIYFLRNKTWIFKPRFFPHDRQCNI